MFFVGVFGIGSKNKNLGAVKFKCTGCINESFSLIELSKTFDLFFIPIFKFSKKYLIVCNSCKSMYEVKQTSLDKILNSKVIQYEDIKEIILEANICPYCNTHTTKEFSFCPKCGKALK